LGCSNNSTSGQVQQILNEEMSKNASLAQQHDFSSVFFAYDAQEQLSLTCAFE
jgi:hypothetical protein